MAAPLAKVRIHRQASTPLAGAGDPVEDQFSRRFKPVAFAGSAASRTVAVAARVVHRCHMLAITAAVLVASQGSGPAERQLGQRALNLRDRLSGILANVLASVVFEDLGHAQFLGGSLSAA